MFREMLSENVVLNEKILTTADINSKLKKLGLELTYSADTTSRYALTKGQGFDDLQLINGVVKFYGELEKDTKKASKVQKVIDGLKASLPTEDSIYKEFKAYLPNLKKVTIDGSTFSLTLPDADSDEIIKAIKGAKKYNGVGEPIEFLFEGDENMVIWLNKDLRTAYNLLGTN